LCYIDPPFNSKRNYNQIYNNIGDGWQVKKIRLIVKGAKKADIEEIILLIVAPYESSLLP
jgi:hypothetical protein